MHTFVAVGRALAEVRDRHLYRATHPTFATYTRDRLALSHSRSCQLINSARTADAIFPDGNLPPVVREATCRMFTPIRKAHGDAAARAAFARVLEQHAGDKPPTAPDIKRALAQLDLPAVGRSRPRGGRPPRVERLDVLLSEARACADRFDQRTDPHELHRLADAARDLAAQLDRLARPAEPMDEDYLCLTHATGPRDRAGVCQECRRPDRETTA